MVLIKPEIGGKPPLPRYGHSMVFNDVQNIVIIYGGRNDYENSFFGDVHILKLNLLCWVSVKVQGIPKAPRASHCACSFSFYIYFFLYSYSIKRYETCGIWRIEFEWFDQLRYCNDRIR